MGGFLALFFKFGPLLLSLIPHIPDVVNAVQAATGPTQGNGAGKLDLAMQLAVGVVPSLEDAFNVSPSVRAIVSGVMSLGYDILKAEGKVTGAVNPASPVVAVVARTPMVIPAQPVAQPDQYAPGQ